MSADTPRRPSFLPFRLEDTYARAVPALSLAWSAAPVPAPRLLALDEGLAGELGLDPAWLRSPDGVALLAGQVPDGVTTVAQAYAGHQFGGYSPRLGDGRALLLGELVDASGTRRDLHLKGSGRTPFARGGDGKAAVGPMLREHLVSVAMHALGIPTTRALAVVATGETVLRETPLPGAILARVAASHLRVGTFQYAAASGDPALLRSLADYAIARHHPAAAEADEPYLELFRRVALAQAELVAQWSLVGFVHGVMNTDNMTISGETIDYGPCAFLDAYDPATVYSSIDSGGRYAFGNQPAAAQWNLARLGETLIPLIGDGADGAVESATAVLHEFAERYDQAFVEGMADKLGLDESALGDGVDETVRELVRDLLALLQTNGVDWTSFFRALSARTADGHFLDATDFHAWVARRDALLPQDRAAVAARMDAVNPVYVPRNHRVEEALARATAGDLGPFERLLGAVSSPYADRPGLEDLRGPAPAGAPRHITYCGT
ncbi:YdiU family protein [Arsenicicoccus sp. MKL-02]|uniref:Protein nucleotidyltransferase YdiU n=1 Tax=Arsenicicoccus cauae TaxID=2663847 RepID=A0A6I3IXP9_9MICO|nr:YdiU family protein [Arsenicicoccus cauae]MTB73239.1 YdiU family protein [Arsenicicoccus cauae]